MHNRGRMRVIVSYTRERDDTEVPGSNMLVEMLSSKDSPYDNYTSLSK